jgi:4-amino-4-deoxy-L-arabinose transferase-like glycosyltransferase
VITIAAVVVGAVALERIAALLVYPFPHDGLEGTLLYEARILRSGQPLYQPLELHRFLSAPYPPVHYLALAVFDLLPGMHVFFGGRLVSALAACGVAVLAAGLVRRAGAPWFLSGLAAAFMLSAPPLQLWGTRIKPDVLALLWTALGLWLVSGVVAGTGRASERLRLALAAISFALAFYTKQTALAGPLAAGLALLAADVRDWLAVRGAPTGLQFAFGLPARWRTVVFSVLYLALALGAWVVLDAWTQGQYSVHVWWSGSRVEWWSFSLFRKIVSLLVFWWPQMLLALLALALSWKRRGLFVPVCYALVAPLTLLGAGETGSHHNHLLETHLALAVAGSAAAGILLEQGRAARARSGQFALAALAVALLGVQVAHKFAPPAWYTGELAPADPPERYLTFMRSVPGEILADDTGLLFQAGRDLRFDDPSTMGPAAAIGKWDQSGLLEEIAQQRFAAIMIPVNLEHSDLDPAGRWTPEMLAAIKQHYQLAFRDTIYTYVPRP